MSAIGASTKPAAGSPPAGEASWQVECPTAGDTRRLGACLATALRPGDVLLLSGELGSGKTTLTTGLVAALGASEAVTSPTFTLCRTYDSHPVVAHVDCWRVERLQEVVELALEEVVDDGGIVVVEWGEAAAPLLGAGALLARLGAPGDLPDGGRRVELVDPSGRFAGRLDAALDAYRRGLGGDERPGGGARPVGGRA